ncbi:MAG: TonB-dependent siderophore receptor, partial [Pseudomonadota bacterium]|nr:TonB-dependent siderophore receptor [Pseudomonadota bacterium]
MAHRSTSFLSSRALCAAAFFTASAASAQPATTQLAPVTISGRAPVAAGVSGFGEVPLAKVPIQASVYTAESLRNAGVERLADLSRIDPAITDAYNSEGYIDYLTVRGFVLDNRFNFRRDGLPINAETSIPLDNKSRLEVLKGTSGMQSGTSAPGGLVNYVVKRPLAAPLRSALLSWREAGSVLGAVDLSQRFGPNQAFGVRLNAALEHIEPKVRSTRGERNLFALAGDWRLGADTLLEAELEQSHRSQPSQAAFSLLGNAVPVPTDPRINLNNQPWSLPVVFDATTASLRLQQRLNADWRVTAHAATQQLRTDDREAFPFGCTDPNPAPDGTYYPDRYCPNGTFDLYDFRSENERRRLDAFDVALQGRFATGPVSHALTTGVLRSTVRNRFQTGAYNFAGTGNVDGTAVTPAAPEPTNEGTNRDERSTELYLRDAITVNERLTAWLGLRHTRLDRRSVGTEGTAPTDYRQAFTAPWLALSYALSNDHLLYASWGQGVESEVAPNLPRFINRGQPLPALKSRQFEVGVKGASENVSWGIAGFEIVRPAFNDIGACDVDASCIHRVDGNARHRGVEATGQAHAGAWTVDGGAQWLHARREGSADATLDGLKPTNVPAFTLKLQAGYSLAQIAGLSVRGGLVRESSRIVLPDNSTSIPGWNRFDLGARYESRNAG